MVAVPANFAIDLEFQDNRGFRARTTINQFEADISTDANVVSADYTVVLATAGAVAAMSNAKLVKIGFRYDFDYADEPSSETGTYQLVQQKARMTGLDGRGGFNAISIPAPKDTLFLTSADNNLVVVNPASSLVTDLQTALAAGPYTTPRGGAVFAQFMGGQLVGGKPRRRRVLQGQ